MAINNTPIHLILLFTSSTIPNCRTITNSSATCESYIIFRRNCAHHETNAKGSLQSLAPPNSRHSSFEGKNIPLVLRPHRVLQVRILCSFSVFSMQYAFGPPQLVPGDQWKCGHGAYFSIVSQTDTACHRTWEANKISCKRDSHYG